MKKNTNKLMSLMMAGVAMRSDVSAEEAKLISRYLSGREN